MSYHLLTYSALFLPIVIVLYQLAPAKVRWVVMLAADYTFFWLISGKLIVWLILATIVTYATGLLLSLYGRKRYIAWIGAAVNLMLLIGLKYLGIFGLSFVAPIGISYYTLQSISYMTDVYRGTIEAEKNAARIALYLSFFPQIMEGPISRFSETAESLYAGRDISFDNLVYGYQRIIWGLFKKMLIADRIAPLVSKVFSHSDNYDGSAICLAMLCYTMQLYMEFSGCMDIVMGSGEIFGVKLPENFRQPFFAKNAGDFWHRWHITLGTWLKDYIFYPISLAKPVKKLAKKIKLKAGIGISKFVAPTIALFFVWITNGLWHGPKETYIFYGMYYFILIFIENITEAPLKKLKARINIKEESTSYRIFTFMKLFLIVNVGELFFRSDSVKVGFGMIRSMITDFHITRLVDLTLGVDIYDMLLAAICLVIVFTVDVIHEKGISIRNRLASMSLPVRWGVWYAVILMIVIFGAYGAGYTMVDMIYAAY